MATSPAQPTPTGAIPIQRIYKGCSGIRDYQVMDKLGEGTFGEVHKARSRKTSQLVALKKILMHNEKDGFPITALREIKLLKMLSHVNVLKLEEMAVERPKGEGRKKAVLYMVTPYMEHDLSGLLDNPDVKFTEPQIKCYMLQLLEGLRYLHDSHILHRDMKAANLLISNKGILQIADFGLARHYEEEVPRPGKGAGEANRDYTALVVTRWYRPPELLLSLRKYTTAIDLWGAGCVFGEMFKRKPILAGNSDINQILQIFALVGSPNDTNMPGWDKLPGCDGVRQFKPERGNLPQTFAEIGSSAISLLQELLKLDWRKRINAIDALQHPYFKTDPQPARPGDLPTFQDSHELDRRSSRGNKAALPPAPAGGTVGMGPNGESYGAPGGPPPPPPGMSNSQWQNGDRDQRHRGYDRGPPGPPAPARGNYGRGYDRNDRYDRRDGPPRQQWQDDGRRRDDPGHRHPHPLPPPPGEGRHPLPNPPPAYRGPEGRDRDRDRDRDRGPPRGGASGKGNVDTYVPAYNRDRVSKDRDELPTREARRGSHDSRDGRPPSRDDRHRREEYWDRDRHRDRDPGMQRRTRSRSPDRRDMGRRDRDRDDRNVYRR